MPQAESGGRCRARRARAGTLSRPRICQLLGLSSRSASQSAGNKLSQLPLRRELAVDRPATLRPRSDSVHTAWLTPKCPLPKLSSPGPLTTDRAIQSMLGLSSRPPSRTVHRQKSRLGMRCLPQRGDLSSSSILGDRPSENHLLTRRSAPCRALQRLSRAPAGS